MGVVSRTGEGLNRRVHLTDPSEIHQVLLKYPPLPETVVDRFLQFWGELHP
jgi:hypothetical protein